MTIWSHGLGQPLLLWPNKNLLKIKLHGHSMCCQRIYLPDRLGSG